MRLPVKIGRRCAQEVIERTRGLLPSLGPFRPPKGEFSAHSLLAAGKITGELIAESQPEGPCPPGSMTELAGMRQHSHQPWPVFWVMAEDARLVGRSKIWRDPHENVCSEDLYRIKRILSRDRDFSVYHFWRTGGKRLEGAYLSLGGVWNSRPNYFHWLTDGLTRLALEASLPERPRILLPSWRASFLDETLELLALKDRCEFHQEACLRPERFYYCAPTSMTGAYNPMGWSWLRQQFEPYFLSRKINRRIFFTRRSATRVPGDLKKIEALFESRDFEIVDCGEIPVRKQIEIASEASAIAGFHGAAMTNLLWSTEGIPVLEIFESSHLNACYEQIAFERGLDYSMHIREEHAHSHRFFAEWLESHLG